MAEQYFAPEQSNKGWGLTLKMAGKHPAVAERIWRTYSDALEYANDFKGTATDGIVLSILQDTVVGGKTYKSGIYYLKKAATAEGANDAVLVPTGMSEEDLTALINSKIEGNVASIDEISFSDNSLYILYTYVNGEQEEMSVELPTATESNDGLMTAEHVKSLAKKIEGVKINGVTLTGSDGVVQGNFVFDFDKNGENIVLSLGDEVIGSINVEQFVKDGILDTVELATADASGNAGTFMKFTFNTASGKSPIYLNVEKLIDIYKFGNSQVTAGDFVVPTITVHGTGNASDPWQIELTIDDHLIGQRFENITNTINEINDNLNSTANELAALQATVDGIVSVGGEANKVNDVKVNGVSVVTDKVANIPLATTSAAGVMSASDKAKLDSIEEMSEDDILDAIATAFEG